MAMPPTLIWPRLWHWCNYAPCHCCPILIYPSCHPLFVLPSTHPVTLPPPTPCPLLLLTYQVWRAQLRSSGETAVLPPPVAVLAICSHFKKAEDSSTIISLLTAQSWIGMGWKVHAQSKLGRDQNLRMQFRKGSRNLHWVLTPEASYLDGEARRNLNRYWSVRMAD